MLKITPEVLTFTSDDVVITLENPSDAPIAFKVKTTAPRAYLVKPSNGIIGVNETAEIHVVMLPEQRMISRNGDRFLVQFCSRENSDPITKEDWAQIPRAELREVKLGVEYQELLSEGVARCTQYSDFEKLIENNTDPCDPRLLVEFKQALKIMKAQESQLSKKKCGSIGMVLMAILIVIAFLIGNFVRPLN